MSTLYRAKVKSISPTEKSVELLVEAVHPDAMYFSDNLGFALMLLRESANGDAAIAKFIDNVFLSDEKWLSKFTRGFISKCELLSVDSPVDAPIRNDGNFSFWYAETKSAKALIRITVTDAIWIKHLSLSSTWGSTAYSTDITFLPCAPISTETDNELFSDDYIESGGWIVFNKEKTDRYFGGTHPVYVPRYSQRSYRRKNKLEKGDLTKSNIDEMLYKTVFVLTKTRNKGFGILRIYEKDEYCVSSFNKYGESHVWFKLNDIVTIGLAEYNMNDQLKSEVF